VLALDPSTVPGGYTFDKLRDFIGSRLTLVPPLRRRLIEGAFGLGQPAWVAVGVEIDEHVRRASVPAPGGRSELADFAARLHEEPLPRDRPLWQMHVVEGLADDRIAIVAKVHHALMDGVMGMEFMASLFSLEPDAGVPALSPSARVDRVPGTAKMLARSFPDIALRPLRLVPALGGTIHGAARVSCRAIGQRRSRMPGPVVPAPRVPWSAAMTSRRTVAFTSVPLDQTRRIAKDLDASVNDVVLATCGGALRHYLLARGALPERSLLAAVPVSVRDGGGPAANLVSLMVVTLGTDVEDRRDRVKVVHQHARASRGLHEAFGDQRLMAWVGAIAPGLISLGAKLIFESHLLARMPSLWNVVVSNVPGPPMTLYFGGARLEAIYPLGPVVEGAAVNLTVVSTREAIGIGLVSCPDLITDLWEIADAIEREHTAYASGR
jgi:WS/DGAT/MGAT family acyltransferase